MEEYKTLFSDIWELLKKFPVEPGEKKEYEWWANLTKYTNEIAKKYDEGGITMLVKVLDMIEDRSIKGTRILKLEDKKAS